eukprot:1834893-Karenia_brevis.AAC.1
MPKIYPSLIGIFGFGIPYSLMTRTWFEEDMVFVGVPPSDVYHLLKATSLADKALWKSALASMLKVNEGFKGQRYSALQRARQTMELLTGCASRRSEREAYYKHLATKWMTTSGVSVLTMCALD